MFEQFKAQNSQSTIFLFCNLLMYKLRVQSTLNFHFRIKKHYSISSRALLQCSEYGEKFGWRGVDKKCVRNLQSHIQEGFYGNLFTSVEHLAAYVRTINPL